MIALSAASVAVFGHTTKRNTAFHKLAKEAAAETDRQLADEINELIKPDYQWTCPGAGGVCARSLIKPEEPKCQWWLLNSHRRKNKCEIDWECMSFGDNINPFDCQTCIDTKQVKIGFCDDGLVRWRERENIR